MPALPEKADDLPTMRTPAGKEEMMHHHSIREKHGRRWFLYMGRFGLAFEYARGWRGFIATCGYGGQESFFKWCLAFPGLFLHLRFDTPFSWHRLRPWDGKYGESQADFGLRTSGNTLRLLFGHDSMGTYYGTHGRFGWFRKGILNKELVLFRMDWILGRAKFTRTILEEGIPVTVTVGQWDGDSYAGTAVREHCEWKSRFKTVRRDSVTIDMQQGIPFPGKGENSWDCGDDAIYGFGGNDVESAIANVVEHVKRDRERHGGPSWRPTEALR